MNRNVMRILVALATVGVLGAVYYYQDKKKSKGPLYTLPELPYAYEALEPHIDAETMKLHYTKHHQTYVNKLNEALKDYPKLRAKPVTALLENLNDVPEKIRQSVIDNGGGHANHSFFWQVMTPESTKEPVGKTKELINKNFENFDAFKTKFTKAAEELFGSGWVWLVIAKEGALKLVTTTNQDSPLSQGLKPLLALDVWEHAYYLKYHNVRNDYIKAWWSVVNWKQVEKNLEQATVNNKVAA